jgi:protein CpxP
MQRTRPLALSACLLGLLIGFGMLALASQQPPQGGPPGRQRPMSVEERLQRMSERLNLTDEQKEKIRPLLQDEEKQLQALRADTSLSPEQRREKRRQINQATRKQIGEILTPEQKEKWRENARQRRQERREAPPQP